MGLREYTDLSDFVITFDPLTTSDKRWRQIFEDKYARVIFAGYRLNHLMHQGEIDILMEESMFIANEIREGKLKLEHQPIQNRLKEMYEKFCRINLGLAGSAKHCDINNTFIEHLLPYLKEEKPFGYEIKQGETISTK